MKFDGVAITKSEGLCTGILTFIPINKSINKKHACVLRAESEMLQLEESFKDEQTFIEKFASGDTKDVVELNVSGTNMVTMRSTLCTAKDSVLAQQFDDSKWTEQGCNAPRVNEWTPDQVSTWAKSIGGIQEDVSSILKRNNINGWELLALNIDGLKMMGIGRAGTLCLLLKEIEKLEKASRDFASSIEHSPQSPLIIIPSCLHSIHQQHLNHHSNLSNEVPRSHPDLCMSHSLVGR